MRNRGSGLYRQIWHAVCQSDHAGKKLQEQLLHVSECFRRLPGEVGTLVDAIQAVSWLPAHARDPATVVR